MERFAGNRRIAGWFALASIALVVVLNGAPFFTNASKPPRGIASPLVAMEVVQNVDEVDAILSDAPSPDRETMRIKQYVDFFFIAAYAGLYISLARLIRTKTALFASFCGVFAAFFDIVENIGILRILDRPLRAASQGMIDAIRYPSLAKWALVFVASALLGKVFWNYRRVPMRIVAVLSFAAAGLGIIGIYDNSFLVWASLPLFGGIATMAIAFVFLR